MLITVRAQMGKEVLPEVRWFAHLALSFIEEFSENTLKYNFTNPDFIIPYVVNTVGVVNHSFRVNKF